VFYEEGIQKPVPRYDKCLKMAANIWKNSLKNLESDNNKKFYENLFDSFLQRNGTYFLNRPRR